MGDPRRGADKLSRGQVLGKAEAIFVMDALRTITSEAAWQNFEEKDRGSLEPGKLADFVILDRNPLTIPAVEIRDVRVVETVIGGENVSTQCLSYDNP